ncbi:MAG: hypothetical protein EBT07_03765 [Actinobacteria bacterium]|nr:hypothetical protein [Actinomycetota bacterium]
MPLTKRTAVKNSVRAPTPAPASIPATKPTPTPPLATFGQTVKEGLAFGIGQSVAHNVIGSMFRTVTTVTTAAAPVAAVAVTEKPEYTQCMKESFGDKELCKQFL